MLRDSEIFAKSTTALTVPARVSWAAHIAHTPTRRAALAPFSSDTLRVESRRYRELARKLLRGVPSPVELEAADTLRRYAGLLDAECEARDPK